MEMLYNIINNSHIFPTICQGCCKSINNKAIFCQVCYNYFNLKQQKYIDNYKQRLLAKL